MEKSSLVSETLERSLAPFLLSMQMCWIPESSCLSVVPGTEDSDTPVSPSLVLIASPVLCSPAIKGSTVVAVRVVVRLGSVAHRRSSQLASATMAGWSAPLLLTSRARRSYVTGACAWSWLSHPRPPDLDQHRCAVSASSCGACRSVVVRRTRRR